MVKRKLNEKKFITSTADIDLHCKVEPEDSDIEEQYKKQFKELCKKFTDIIFKDASGVGKTN